MSSSDIIKDQVPFLRHEVNHKHDYQLIKSGKSVYNFSKKQLYSTTHQNIQNYFINPKNNYSSNPFNGSSSTYIEFDIPKINATFYQFVFRFSLQNTSNNAVASMMPPPLIIEKVSLLKNSNSLGLDVDSWDIFLYNL